MRSDLHEEVLPSAELGIENINDALREVPGLGFAAPAANPVDASTFGLERVEDVNRAASQVAGHLFEACNVAVPSLNEADLKTRHTGGGFYNTVMLGYGLDEQGATKAFAAAVKAVGSLS